MNSGNRSSRRGFMLIGAGLAALLSVLAPLVGSSVAHANTVVPISTSPVNGSTIPTSPAMVAVTFNQQIGSAVSAVVACNGSPAPTGAARLSPDGLSLVVDLAATPLPKGDCAVSWQVQGIAEPGVQKGNFQFKVAADTVATTASAPPATGATTPKSTATASAAGSSAPADDTTDGATKLTGPLGLARFISAIAIATLFGSLVLITVAWPEGVEYILTIRFLRSAWIVAVLSTGAMVTILTAQVTNKNFSASISPAAWKHLTSTTPGIAALARVALVVICGWVAIRPERVIDPTTQLPALALPGLAVATMGFTRAGGDLEIIGYAAGVGHALAIAVWFGGLMLLARVVLAGPGDDDLVHAVRGFGKLATPAMLITVVTGGIQVYRLDSGHLLDTNHGRWVLVKIVPVIAMVFVGVATRQFVRARLSRAESMEAPIAAKLRRAVGMEALIGAVVLAITAILLSTQPANLVAKARSSDTFAYQWRITDAAGTNDVKLSLDPAKVGRNELFLEVTQPVSGIDQIVIDFSPPRGTPSDSVRMVINNMHGQGVAHLDRSIGIPLGVPGAWTVTINIRTASGVFAKQNSLNVRAGAGVTVDKPIPVVTEPPVTSPPTTTSTTIVTTTP